MSANGLGFLNKKSWHVGSYAMREKVARVEARQQAEQKATEQLTKEFRKAESVDSHELTASLLPIVSNKQVECSRLHENTRDY